ncbi:MAG: gluconate 2-dehydrogenase subunit 3 family protein [Bryobacteraceae bacterium]
MELSDKKDGIGRRTLLQVLPFALMAGRSTEAAGCHDPSEAQDKKPYEFQFFTEPERKLLDEVMEKIIPGDSHSPGAREAKVSNFADLMVSTSPDYVRDDWREGLRLLTETAKSSSLDEWLQSASTHEEDPQTVLDVFFVKLKQMTIEGYYTSAIGIHQDLEYQGNQYLTRFEGCTHPEHQGAGLKPRAG